MDLGLHGKHAIVTGGSRGIGKALLFSRGYGVPRKPAAIVSIAALASGPKDVAFREPRRLA